MALRFEPFADTHIPAVQAFNARIASAVPYSVGTSPVGQRASSERSSVWIETMLVLDGDDVRGSVMLQHQELEVGGEKHHSVNIQLPISEGLIDRRYAYLGMWIIQRVTAEYPFAFGVGMGGLAQPLPRLLSALGWETRLAPFLYFVHRPARFLREMPLLRQSTARRLGADIGAWSGVGHVAVRAAQAARRVKRSRTRRLTATRVDEWGPWADEIWSSARLSSSAISVRSSRALRALYPLSAERVLGFRLSDRGRDVGWTALIATKMSGSDKFGNLYVGTMLDALALPGYERAVADSVRRLFDDIGTDLSIANHSHATWVDALRGAGFFTGPSNYVVAMSKNLSAASRAARPDGADRIHVTRGDGDGRLHL